MQVRVLYFGILRELLGRSGESVELSDGAAVGALLETIRDRKTAAHRVWDTLAVAVNEEYAGLDAMLSDGDEVALLPPVSGGSGPGTASRAGAMRVELTRSQIPVAQLLEAAKAGEDGAVVLFDGIVRNNTRGRETLYLVYEAYEKMALKQMQALAAEAVTRFSVRDVTLVHRLGRLEIGETSVVIAVASAHRGAAFEACRWMIDTLKKTVPIWKKEHFVDGAVWADGEPFPEEIAVSSAPVGTR